MPGESAFIIIGV